MYFASPKARISSKMKGNKNNPTVNHTGLPKLLDNKSRANTINTILTKGIQNKRIHHQGLPIIRRNIKALYTGISDAHPG